MTRSYVGYDSFVYVTRLIHMCDVTHSHTSAKDVHIRDSLSLSPSLSLSFYVHFGAIRKHVRISLSQKILVPRCEPYGSVQETHMLVQYRGQNRPSLPNSEEALSQQKCVRSCGAPRSLQSKRLLCEPTAVARMARILARRQRHFAYHPKVCDSVQQRLAGYQPRGQTGQRLPIPSWLRAYDPEFPVHRHHQAAARVNAHRACVCVARNLTRI